MRISISGYLTAALLAGLSGTAVHATEAGNLRVGAAKVDITPSMDWGLYNAWGTKFSGVHDPIYVRAIVIDNGSASAAIVAIETSGSDFFSQMAAGITKATGIPGKNLILVATHDHNAPRVGLSPPRARGNNPAPPPSPGAQAWVDKVTKAVVDAVSQAKAGLQPAVMALGTGAVDVNINRDQWTPAGYRLGNNPQGPSDKTVWVMRFEKPSGEPIALFVNYAVHAVVVSPDNNQVTGDISGAASRWVEQRYPNHPVVLWTSGAAGDQNPKYMSWGMSWGPTYVGGRATESPFPLNDALGLIMGEEIARVSENITGRTGRSASSRLRKSSPVLQKRRPAP